MINRAGLLIAALASTLISSNAFAAGPFGTIHLGNWQGGAYTNDTTGAFSHCAAGASYQNVSLNIGQNANRSWLIGFFSPSWNMPEGQSFQLTLTFDGQSHFQIFGNSTHGKLITAILPDPALNTLRKSHLMVLTDSQHAVSFELPMVDKLVPMIANCVERVKTNGVANAGDFSIASTKPLIARAAAKPDVENPSGPQKLIDVTGTGFVISSEGHIVTNNHVIGECVGDIHGNLVGQSAAKLRVVSTDARRLGISKR